MTSNPSGLEVPKAAAGVLPSALNARRLVWIRSIAIPGSAVCLLGARQVYGLSIPVTPLVVIVLCLAGFNWWTLRRLREPRPISDTRLFMQMVVDVLALTGILYYSGGAANPFAFFFLLPLTITATLLPPRYTWAMAGVTAACYTLLLVVRVTVPAFSQPVVAGFIDLHVVGMWLGFVVIAGLIAHFVVGMAETLRETDRNLAALREQALRDERMIATATLAAGAAHELSTPLATMSVVAEELESALPVEDSATQKQVGILRAQIARCKDALSVLSASAGVTRAEAAERVELDRFVARAVEEVRRLRPGAEIRLAITGQSPAPSVVVDRTLTQALLNVLHNAVDAAAAGVRAECDWTTPRVRISVSDRGPGLGHGAASKNGGLGLGLFLSEAAVRQHGGEIRVQSRPGGGTQVVIEIPLARLAAAAA